MDKTTFETAEEEKIYHTTRLLDYLKFLSENDDHLDILLKKAMKEAGHTEVILPDGTTEPL